MTIQEAKKQFPQKDFIETNIGLYLPWELAYLSFNEAIAKINEKNNIRYYCIRIARYRAFKELLAQYRRNRSLPEDKEYSWAEITSMLGALTKN